MIVADASVLSNALADFGPSGTSARRRLRGEVIAVPDLAYVETAAVLRKQWIRKRISEPEFEQGVAALRAGPFVPYGSKDLLHRAFELRHNVSAYDAMYLALAEGLQCTLVTGDARLVEAVAARGARCNVEVLTD